MSARLTPSSLSKTGTMFDNVQFRAPGPGAYETNRSSLSSSGSVMSFRARELKSAIGPGPSSYNTQSASSLITKSAAAYSVRPKTSGSIFDEIAKNSIKVGPGSYNTEYSSLSRTGSTISGRYIEPKKQPSPGPSQYSTQEAVRSISNRAPGYSMKFSQKQVFQTTKMQNIVPGPGAFTYQLDTLHKRGTGPFAKDGLNKRQKKVKSPGVGQYNIETKINQKQAPSYTLSGRHSIGSTF
ncbi:SHIPPO 1-like protein [Spironucleus salmonicida]|uniref:SHIPPO 1-like protein n=1 Tax=Spironucleus salmonicida TaxID=348837 RepID=V6LI88_9EUKA|nr:SHIPPO 1-like protein [Spironucleus salmonicida]|eukprot:EST44252.1 SHIPPO 1-like protein [Spironucleus salmonicida]